jgi:SWI/SNF-related matrix-associated actin-dependent regulator of chromatin subfamily A member 5
MVEAERKAAQDFIDNGVWSDTLLRAHFDSSCRLAEPLTEQETELKERYIEEGFPDWSRRDFQQFVRALEAYGWCVCQFSHYTTSLN